MKKCIMFSTKLLTTVFNIDNKECLSADYVTLKIQLKQFLKYIKIENTFLKS